MSSAQVLPVQQDALIAPTHPGAFICHFAFKATALTYYLLCELLNSGQFVTNFVICIVLLAMDFWVVKNVTGRLLVGLRWWNDASDAGSTWRFESLSEGQRVINPHEKRWFWIILVANPILWALESLTALLGFSWGYFLIPVTGVVLGVSNLIGYFKCSKEAGAQVKSMGTSLLTSAVTSRISAAISRVG